jgi:regulator of sigma D
MMNSSTAYQDQLVRVRIDVEDAAENWQAMREIKEALKTRFEQLDIWITAHRVEVL